MTTLIVAAALAIVLIVSLIILISVLIKQFKHGGALHGVIGLITAFIWTFIWGWLKHKEAKLTKVMILLTFFLLILASPFVLKTYMDVPVLNDVEKTVTAVIKDRSIDPIMEILDQQGTTKIAGKKSKKSKKVAKKKR